MLWQGKILMDRKQLLGGVAAVALLIGGAMQAQANGMEPVEPPPGWGGFYMGGHAGYASANRDGFSCWDDLGEFDGPLPDECENGFFFDYDQTGWLAGAQIGYNRQRNKFIFGLEVDASLSDIDGELTEADTSGDDFEPGLSGGNGEWTWLATATARVGYGGERAMVYVEAGLALGGFDFDGFSGCSFSQNRSGVAYGGGVEVKVSERASLKAEYNRLDFGKESQACSASFFIPLPIYNEADAKLDVVKIGFNYLLGPE